jgi:hypothetical protein
VIAPLDAFQGGCQGSFRCLQVTVLQQQQQQQQQQLTSAAAYVLHRTRPLRTSWDQSVVVAALHSLQTLHSELQTYQQQQPQQPQKQERISSQAAATAAAVKTDRSSGNHHQQASSSFSNKPIRAAARCGGAAADLQGILQRRGMPQGGLVAQQLTPGAEGGLRAPQAVLRVPHSSSVSCQEPARKPASNVSVLVHAIKVRAK